MRRTKKEDETAKRMPLALRSALTRRDYWRTTLAHAEASGNKEAAANAKRFIDEYDILIAISHDKPKP